MGGMNIAPGLEPFLVDVDSLSELPGNPRRGDVEAVKRSYERFGQRKPIVARRDGKTTIVVAGNHQLRAAKELGWEQIAVVFADDLTDDEARGYALADNRVADLGTYDDADLLTLLGSVADDAAILAAAGYTSDDLDVLRAATATAPTLDDPDDVPDKVAARTVRGDVWLLGPHRVMCGDSTVPTDVERLMVGSKADMVWTDPPYGVAYVGKTADALTIENDDLNVADLETFLRAAFTLSLASCRDGAVWFVAAPPGPPFHAFGSVLLDLGVWRQTLAWVKDVFVMGYSDYHYRCECMIFGWKPGAAHTKTPDRKQDNVWEFDRPKRSEDHPTTKPVALVERAVNNHTRPGDLVFDPFGGSGTTLIAAHVTNRRCYTMELDEHYCDVICARFQKSTGIVPVNETTGNEHDFLT